MTDTLTPGSEWLLPVRHLKTTIWQDRPILTVVPYGGNSSVLIPVEDPASLIPASRLADLEAEVARLRAGLTAIWDDTYPRSHQLNGQCKHDRYIHEQCEECIWDYAHTVLNPQMEAR